MNINTCLKLADFAKKDSTLIQGHKTSGVACNIKKHLNETVWLLLLLPEKNSSMSELLKREQTQLTEALSVYE